MSDREAQRGEPTGPAAEDPHRHEREVEICNRLGVHARPAAEFVKLAGRYVADIRVERNGMEVNGKSIMGVLTLAAEQGAVLRIRGHGHDAVEAVEELARLVERGFDYESAG